MGIHGKIWRMLIAIYKKVTRKVICGNEISEGFDIKCGLAQGSILSPFLYDCFINNLITQLKAAINKDGTPCQYGVRIASHIQVIPLLCYADDIVLLAPTPQAMRQMLTCISQYATK
jgi:hypothetical protein